MKKIIIATLLAIITLINSVSAGAIDQSITARLTGVEKTEYINAENNNQLEFAEAYVIHEQGWLEFYSGDNERIEFTMKVPYVDMNNVIYTMIVYENNNIIYTRNNFSSEETDMYIDFQPNSNIKITFNALNIKNNLIVPAQLYILGAYFAQTW